MAQLPDANNANNNSIMDDVKVNQSSQNEGKQSLWNEYNDNDSLKNHIDSDDIQHHHSIIQNRDNAPEPPSSLTMASLQHFDDENPPQNMLQIGSNLLEQESGGNSSQPQPDLGLGDMLGSFAAHHNNVPDMLIDPLIEMGFTRKKAIYALQQSEGIIGSLSVEYALQWLFENPTFEPPDTSNIAATINNMIGHDLLGLKSNKNDNLMDPSPPKNSPDHLHGKDGGLIGIPSNNGSNTNGTDNFLYDLIENASHSINKSKSNRIYKHSGTLGSAATQEEKDNVEKEEYNTHQPTTSTVTSELSALSGIRSQSPSLLNNNSTKQHIQQLYIEQQKQNTVSSDIESSDLKMVIVVRKDLKMSSGKVAAQCCHGCLGVVFDILNEQHINNNNNDNNIYDLRLILRLWRMNGEKKIVLQCLNEKKLLELKDKAMIYNLPHYLVCDAGHTQIKAGSRTVLAIGPYPSQDIDKVTKELKLY